MNKRERIKEVKRGKLFLIVLICIELLVIYFLDYDFSNNLYNGVILLSLSLLLSSVLNSEKYFIKTGYQPKDSTNAEHFKIFNTMHPYDLLRNKIIAIAFIVSLLVSFVLIVSSFFGQGE